MKFGAEEINVEESGDRRKMLYENGKPVTDEQLRAWAEEMSRGDYKIAEKIYPPADAVPQQIPEPRDTVVTFKTTASRAQKLSQLAGSKGKSLSALMDEIAEAELLATA